LFKKGKGVGRGSGEAGEHRAAGADAAHTLRALPFTTVCPEADLAAARHRYMAISTHAQNGGAVPARGGCTTRRADYEMTVIAEAHGRVLPAKRPQSVLDAEGKIVVAPYLLRRREFSI